MPVIIVILAVTKMLAFAVEEDPDSPRIARVRHINVKTLVTGHTFDEVDISDPRRSATGANNTISYQPRYQDTTDFGHGGSNTAAVFFINMREVFPCINSLSYLYNPVCKIFTNEEDGFRRYRSLIEAADSGNHFHIFGSYIPTYGFGIQGCSEFTMDCLPTHHQFVIVCYVPC